MKVIFQRMEYGMSSCFGMPMDDWNAVKGKIKDVLACWVLASSPA
jgi:hypothetical protein